MNGPDALMTNPLLRTWGTPHAMPPFAEIRSEHFAPAFEVAMREHRAELDAIAAQAEGPGQDPPPGQEQALPGHVGAGTITLGLIAHRPVGKLVPAPVRIRRNRADPEVLQLGDEVPAHPPGVFVGVAHRCADQITQRALAGLAVIVVERDAQLGAVVSVGLGPHHDIRGDRVP